MLKHTLTLIVLIFSFAGYAQDYSTLWEGYFSYYDIKDVTRGNTKVFAASENAVFSYDVETNELETITTVNGLSGETITTIMYSEIYQVLLIGYENGLIEIVSDTDDDILSVVDILEKETISPSIKQINHFNEHEGLVYISTNYGISVYDLARREFGDTYFMGNGGSQIIVTQTTIFENQIYASCKNGNGLKKALLSNPNLIDYQQWETFSGSIWGAIQSVSDKLYAIRLDKKIFEIVGNNKTLLLSYSDLPLDVKEIEGNLIVATKNDVFIYDSNFNELSHATINSDFDTDFTSATYLNDHIYIGTDSFGVLKTLVSDPITYEEIRPEGPLKNNAFKIESGNNELWVTYGDYSSDYNPWPLRKYGVSHFIDEEWHNIPFDSLLNAQNLNYVALNPFNPSQVFMSSYISGMLELNNEIPTTLHDQNNSGLESLVVPDAPNIINIRQSGLQFDRTGILWMLTSRVDRPLKSYDPGTGQWQGYSFEEIIPNGLTDEIGFNDLVIDRNGTKWAAGFLNGIMGFNENVAGTNIGSIKTLEANLPTTDVRALAVDDRNQLWIGTIKGIRVLYNTSNFFNDPNPSVNEIIIVEDGLPQELLSNQFISDIKVDGSNNKWIGTLDSGIFYFSPDGQETIYHFTKGNSPLPSNTITDISIDAIDGRVFIATDKGLVSFLSGGSKPEKELANAFAYPNPVRPEYNLLGFDDLNNITKGVKIKGLTENVNIKITDIEGNLVTEAQSGINLRSSKANYNFAIDGGTAIWNGKNLADNIVASGVYLLLISDLDTFETKVVKLLIIR
ncbi:ABC transporter substrate-binding protein [Flavobacteriales bacterium 34_180_T64]|nr:ABC transporter substrate-binding protein [Flavobacteriales bacterium 34_180_T64]